MMTILAPVPNTNLHQRTVCIQKLHGIANTKTTALANISDPDPHSMAAWI
jgi:hypothetical protein